MFENSPEENSSESPKKKLSPFVIGAAICVVLVALIAVFGQCDHEWVEATCTEPRTCKKCEKTEGDPLGHDWAEATCEKPKTCKRCHETDGEALGHSVSDWVVDTESACVEKGSQHGTCERCGETVSEELTSRLR